MHWHLEDVHCTNEWVNTVLLSKRLELRSFHFDRVSITLTLVAFHSSLSLFHVRFQQLHFDTHHLTVNNAWNENRLRNESAHHDA